MRAQDVGETTLAHAFRMKRVAEVLEFLEQFEVGNYGKPAESFQPGSSELEAGTPRSFISHNV